MNVFKRALNCSNFENAKEMNILLNNVKNSHRQRRFIRTMKDVAMLKIVDVNLKFDRGERAIINVRMLFESVMSCDELIAQLKRYQKR